MPRFLLRSLLAGMVGAALAAPAAAVLPDTDGFRIDNSVYAGNDREPSVRTTTLFLDGVVYDFMEQPQEAIVLEKEAGRFTLLNMNRRVRTELSVEEVVGLNRGMRERAAAHENPFVRFLAEPEFEERFDLASGALTLDSPWITYKIEMINVDDSTIAEVYRDFADMYCQVNTMLNPSASPPFARMQVNAALAERHAIPAAIHLTIRPKRSFPPTRFTMRSEHELVRSVGQPDLDRVAQTREFMSIFKLVSFEEYRQGEGE